MVPEFSEFSRGPEVSEFFDFSEFSEFSKFSEFSEFSEFFEFYKFSKVSEFSDFFSSICGVVATGLFPVGVLANSTTFADKAANRSSADIALLFNCPAL